MVMPAEKQALGERGEKAVYERVPCPRCNRARHLARLPTNFQCADLICKFCGFLAQVKSYSLAKGENRLPDRIPGAAWGPQHDQIVAGIYHGLYLAGFAGAKLVRIDYIPAHIVQGAPEVFEPKKPLSAKAKRAGWQGFNYNLTKLPPIGIKQVFP